MRREISAVLCRKNLIPSTARVCVKSEDTTRFSAWSSTSAYKARPNKREDTTRFSGVEFQLRPTAALRQHKTPPASAAWSFNFDLQQIASTQDTTRFSGVEFQLQPTKLVQINVKTPPASAEWSFNFSLSFP